METRKQIAMPSPTGFPCRAMVPKALVWAIIPLGLLLPNAIGNPFYVSVALNGVFLGIGALAVAFLAFHCGLVTFGIAGFSGAATYIVAISTMSLGLSIWQSISCAVAGVVFFSLVIGALIVRTGHLQFAMITLALGQMLKQAVQITSFRTVTAGDDGITVVYNGTLFGLSAADLANPVAFWPIAWISMCAVAYLTWSIAKSPFGARLRAIQDNEERMRFSGFNTFLPRVLAFGLTGFIASISGTLTALHLAYASPEALDFSTGAHMMTAAFLGGISSTAGPILGGIIFSTAQDKFSALGLLDLFTGVVVVVFVWLAPRRASYWQRVKVNFRKAFSPAAYPRKS